MDDSDAHASARPRIIESPEAQVPRRSRITDGADPQAPRRNRFTDGSDSQPSRRNRRRTAGPDARVPAADPAIERPDWAIPFEDGRWDDSLGQRPETDDRNGRRTVVVTGRPGAQHRPVRERSAGATARQRRHTPTRARLAGRPDRVALWAVALGLIMAAMAGFTGGHGHASHGVDSGAPAPVFDR